MSKTGNTLVAILAGAAVGAVAGILMAPEKGEETRKRIGKGFKDGTDELNRKFDDLKTQVKSALNTNKRDFESTISALVDSAEDKSEDIINALENKLKDLKKKASDAAAEVKKQTK
ncbi:YtxH domain-containing protein [Avrilella dinanensis]|uniref:Gas vesicle protein n=1 Tax=Avrilella dinanensis TaxID=2008672 RepID=A0A2M9R331_9FLAO|nr:YtxH domain-containing protein [Avrilella dinanensis]PJR03274.1 hypothetical protein CDL10_01250 [Avrilella dinanensis]